MLIILNKLPFERTLFQRKWKREKKQKISKGQLVRHGKEGMGSLFHLPFVKEKTLHIASVPLTWEINIKNTKI